MFAAAGGVGDGGLLEQQNVTTADAATPTSAKGHSESVVAVCVVAARSVVDLRTQTTKPTNSAGDTHPLSFRKDNNTLRRQDCSKRC